MENWVVVEEEEEEEGVEARQREAVVVEDVEVEGLPEPEGLPVREDLEEKEGELEAERDLVTLVEFVPEPVGVWEAVQHPVEVIETVRE